MRSFAPITLDAEAAVTVPMKPRLDTSLIECLLANLRTGSYDRRNSSAIERCVALPGGVKFAAPNATGDQASDSRRDSLAILVRSHGAILLVAPGVCKGKTAEMGRRRMSFLQSIA
jgi:hypothetical protein